MLKINVISDKDSWINHYIPELVSHLERLGHNVRHIQEPKDIPEGDVLFILGYYSKIERRSLNLNKHNLVVHESDLPKGRGWSPLFWHVLDGVHEIPIVLFEAGDEIDAGPIYLRGTIKLDGTELRDDLRRKQAEKTIELCVSFVRDYPEIISRAVMQKGFPTYYAKLGNEQSELDTNKTLGEQFNKIRMADNENYPLFFVYNGQKYILKVFKS